MPIRRPSPTQCRRLQAAVLILGGIAMVAVGLAYESIVTPRVEQDLADSIVVAGFSDADYPAWAAREGYGSLLGDQTALEFSAFNITNLPAVLSGAEVPALEEVGPYGYTRRGSKYDVAFSTSGGRTLVEYRVDATIEPDDTDDHLLVTANVPYLGVLAQLAALNRTEAYLEAQFANEQLAGIRHYVRGEFLAQAKAEALPRAMVAAYAAQRRAAVPGVLEQVYLDVRVASTSAALVSAAALRREELVPTVLDSVFTRLKSTRIPGTVRDYYAGVRADSVPAVLAAMYDEAVAELLPVTAARMQERQASLALPGFLAAEYADVATYMLPEVLLDTFDAVADWGVPALLETIFVGLYTKLGSDLTTGATEAQTRWRLGTVPVDLDDLVDDPTGSPRYGFELNLDHSLDPEPSAEVTAYLFSQRNDFSFLEIGEDPRQKYRAWHLVREGTDADIVQDIVDGINADIATEDAHITATQVRAIADWLTDWTQNAITVRDRQRQWRQTYDAVVDMDVDGAGAQTGFEMPDADSGLTPDAAAYLWDAAQPLAFTNETGVLTWHKLVTHGNESVVPALAAAHDELTEAQVVAVGDWLRAFADTSVHQDRVLDQWVAGDCRADEVVATARHSALVAQALNDSCEASPPDANASVVVGAVDDDGLFNVTTTTTTTLCTDILVAVPEIQIINATGASEAAVTEGNFTVSNGAGVDATIQLDASAADVQAAFLPTEVHVTKTTASPCPPTAVGVCPSWTVVFTGLQGDDVAELAATQSPAAADIAVETRRQALWQPAVNASTVVETVRDTWARYDCDLVDLRPLRGGRQTGFELGEAVTPNVSLARYLWNASNPLSFLNADTGYPQWLDNDAALAAQLDAPEGTVAAIADWLYDWREHELVREAVREQWRTAMCREDESSTYYSEQLLPDQESCDPDGEANTTVIVDVFEDVGRTTVYTTTRTVQNCEAYQVNETVEHVAVEIQRLPVPASTVTLELDGAQGTLPLTAQSTDGELEAAVLELLPAGAAVNVTAPWTVAFVSSFADFAPLAANDSTAATTLVDGFYGNVTREATRYVANETTVFTTNHSYACTSTGWELETADASVARPSVEATEALWDPASAVSFLNYSALPQWQAAAAGDAAAVDWLLNSSALLLRSRGEVATVARWVAAVPAEAAWHVDMLQETWMAGQEGPWFTELGVPDEGPIDVQPYEPGAQTGFELASGCGGCASDVPRYVARYVWNASQPLSFLGSAGYEAWVAAAAGDADAQALLAADPALAPMAGDEAWVADVAAWLDSWANNVLVVDDVLAHWATAACVDPAETSSVAWAVVPTAGCEAGVSDGGNGTTTTVVCGDFNATHVNQTTTELTAIEFECQAIDLEPEQAGDQFGFELDPQRAHANVTASLARDTLRDLWDEDHPFSFLTLDGYLAWEDDVAAGEFDGLTNAQAAVIRDWVVGWAYGDLLTAEVLDTWRLPISDDAGPVDLDVDAAGVQDGFELELETGQEPSAANGDYLWNPDNTYSFLNAGADWDAEAGGPTGYRAWLAVLSGARPSTEWLVDDGMGSTAFEWQAGNGTLREQISNATNTEPPCRDPDTLSWDYFNLTLVTTTTTAVGANVTLAPPVNQTVALSPTTDWDAFADAFAAAVAPDAANRTSWATVTSATNESFVVEVVVAAVLDDGDSFAVSEVTATSGDDVDITATPNAAHRTQTVEYDCENNGLTVPQILRVAEWLAEWADNELLRQWFQGEWDGAEQVTDVSPQLAEGFPSAVPLQGLELGLDVGLQAHVLERLWDPAHNASFLHPDGFAVWCDAHNGSKPWSGGAHVEADAAARAALASRTNSQPPCWSNSTRSYSVFYALPPAGLEGNVTVAETTDVEQTPWRGNTVSNVTTVLTAAVNGTVLWRNVTVFTYSPCPARDGLSAAETQAVADWLLGWVDHPLTLSLVQTAWRESNDVAPLPPHSQPFRAYPGCEWCPEATGWELRHAFVGEGYMSDVAARELGRNFGANATALEAYLLWNGSSSGWDEAYLASWAVNPLVQNAVQAAWLAELYPTTTAANATNATATVATPSPATTAVLWDQAEALSFLNADGAVMWRALVSGCETSDPDSGACVADAALAEDEAGIAAHVTSALPDATADADYIADVFLKDWLDSDALAAFMVGEYPDASALTDLPALQYGRGAVTLNVAGVDSLASLAPGDVAWARRWDNASAAVVAAPVRDDWGTAFPEAFAFCRHADTDTADASHRAWAECADGDALSLAVAAGALDEMGADAVVESRMGLTDGVLAIEFLQALPHASEEACLASAAAVSACELTGEAEDGSDEWWPVWHGSNATELAALRSHLSYIATVLVFEPEVESRRGGLYTARSVHDVLFGGYEDPLLARLLAQNQSWLVPAGSASFSMLSAASETGLRQAYTGVATPYASALYDVGQLVLWDGAESNELWGTTTAVSGSDGTQFEPNLLGVDDSDRVVSLPTTVSMWWAEGMRPLEVAYTGDTTRYGIDLRRFKLSTLPRLDGEGEADEATPLNFVDVSALYGGVTVLLGYPHFLNGVVSSIRDGVTGLAADEDAHDSVWDVEPLTGQTANVRWRFQTNVQTAQTDTWHQTHSDAVLPVYWQLQTASISEATANAFKADFVSPLDAVDKVPVVLYAGGAMLIIVGFAVLVFSLVFRGGPGAAAAPGPAGADVVAPARAPEPKAPQPKARKAWAPSFVVKSPSFQLPGLPSRLKKKNKVEPMAGILPA